MHSMRNNFTSLLLINVIIYIHTPILALYWVSRHTRLHWKSRITVNYLLLTKHYKNVLLFTRVYKKWIKTTDCERFLGYFPFMIVYKFWVQNHFAIFLGWNCRGNNVTKNMFSFNNNNFTILTSKIILHNFFWMEMSWK